MSEKPKRTLTEEQKEKMRAGREKAMAERKKAADKEAKEKKKKEQEEKREQKRKDKIVKEDEKKKQLDAELQALQQEKDRIEVSKKTRENRDKFRNKLKEPSIEMSIEDLPSDGDLPEEHHEIIAHDEEQEPIDEEKLFYEKVHDIAKQQRPEVAKVFRNLTSGYDRKKDITDNLQAMIADVKAVIKKNVEEIKSTKKVVDKEEEKQEVISRKEEEVKEQKKYVSQLHTLMRLR